MKKILLTMFAAISLQAQSQIVVTQAEMPFAGDELYRTRANNNPFLNYGATGANHVWNFSNLVATTQDSAVYQSVSSTNFVYALVYADIFFNPNRANHARAGVDIPFSNLLPIANPYTFFYRNSSIYKKVGYGTELAGIPLPIIYSDQDEIYSLPLNYGDNDSTFSAYNLSIPTLAYYGYEQSRLNNVDGWGVITTPNGTFDVIRVKTTLIGKDTVQLDSLNVGFSIDRPVINEYKWLANNIRVPILQINTTTIFGLELITDIFFYDEPRSIAVVPPLATTLCPGSTVQVNYNETGVFNPGGFLSAPNIFRAQLSDANGSFATPINIGSITSTQSGIINATIPANIPLGTGYRIRVISTNPAFTGSDNGIDITMGTNPFATVAAAGSTTFCDGDSVLLTAGTDPSYTYQWQLNGTDINGAVNSDLMVLDAGNYNVLATNVCGSSTSTILAIVVNDLPEHTFSQSGFISCNGSLVTIASQNATGQTNLSYQWYLNGNLLAGETNSDIVSSLPGNYSLGIINNVTGCAYTTSPVQISNDILVEPVITSNGATTFCDGGTVVLDIIPEPSTNYQWYLDGVVIPGATGSNLTVSSTGLYTVEATNMNGCTALSGIGIGVTVNPLPNSVALTSNGATTFCAGNSALLEFIPEPGVIYQWQLNGIDITGATSNSLLASLPGSYTVIPTGSNGCLGAVSSAIIISVDPLPVAPVLAATGPSTFCDGGVVAIDFMPDAGNVYQWTLDGVLIPGANDTSYSAATSGNYSVIATSINGCTSVVNPGIVVTVMPLPSQPVISSTGSTTFCQGGSVALNFIPEPGVTYQWQLNGVDIPGAINAGIVALSPGNYTVNALGLGGCINTSVAGVNVTINPLPVTPVITANGSTTFCDGGSVTLEVPLQTGISYQWLVDNVNINGANANQYTVTSGSGFYTVNITDVNGCSSIATISYQVVINPLPVVPVITQSYDTLFASGSGSFQWYLNGNPILGATSSFVIALVNGNYTVMVSDGNACENISVVFPFNSVGITEASIQETMVYPNPSNGIFNVGISSPSVDNLSYSLIDLTGKTIESGWITDHKFVIDISERASGIYILRLIGGTINSSIKLSKQ